ncbi:MerR family transcriptional regulator [Microbacter sp. GSS18]|nr:MerR family transcriptional regulator [Microbacter sp. GSS18]
MRISELAHTTGVSVASIKYYLREGLLPEGVRSSPTQADYGPAHVRRLGVIRALMDSGVSIAGARKVIAVLDDPPESPHELLGTAHAAVTPPADAGIDTAAAEALIAGLGWRPGMCDEATVAAVARSLQNIERAGFEMPPAVVAEYVEAMRRIADAEIAHVPLASPDEAVRYVVLGSVLVEPLLLSLRRAAEQIASAERFDQE